MVAADAALRICRYIRSGEGFIFTKRFFAIKIKTCRACFTTSAGPIILKEQI